MSFMKWWKPICTKLSQNKLLAKNCKHLNSIKGAYNYVGTLDPMPINQAPVYLRELCAPVSSLPDRRSLRSAEQGDLVVPRVRLATAQRRSFAVVGPSFWNALPSRLRSELLAL